MKYSLKRKQERPKAFLGAALATAASLIGTGIGAYGSYRSRKQQEEAMANQAALKEANSLTDQINTGIQNEDIINRQMLSTPSAAKGGRFTLKRDIYSSPVERTPYITSKRGSFIPVGDGLNYIVGPKHEQGGINVDFLSKGGRKKLGVEVEGGEAEFKKGGAMYVLSAQPYLGMNGISPSQLAVNGIVPKEVAYNLQEQNKAMIGKPNDKNSLLAPPVGYNQFGRLSLGNVSGMGFARLGGKKSQNTQDRKKAKGGYKFKDVKLNEKQIAEIMNRRKRFVTNNVNNAEQVYEPESNSNPEPSFWSNLTLDAIKGKVNEIKDKVYYSIFPDNPNDGLTALAAGNIVNHIGSSYNKSKKAGLAGALVGMPNADEINYASELASIEEASKSSRNVRNDGSHWKHIYGSANEHNKFGLRAANEQPKYGAARSIATPWKNNPVASVNYWKTHSGDKYIGSDRNEHPIYFGVNPADSSLVVSENLADFSHIDPNAKSITKSYYVAGSQFATDKYGRQIYDLQPGNVRDQPVMRNAKGELSGHLTPYIRKNMPNGVDNPFNAIVVGVDSKGKTHWKAIYGKTLNEFKADANNFMNAFKNRNQDFKFVQFDSGMNRHAYEQDNVWNYPALVQYDRLGGKHSLRGVARCGGKMSLSRPKAEDGFYYDSDIEDFLKHDLEFDPNTGTLWDKNNPNNKIDIDTLAAVNYPVAEALVYRLNLPDANSNDSIQTSSDTTRLVTDANTIRYDTPKTNYDWMPRYDIKLDQKPNFLRGLVIGTPTANKMVEDAEAGRTIRDNVAINVNPISDRFGRFVTTYDRNPSFSPSPLNPFVDDIVEHSSKPLSRQQVYDLYGKTHITGNFPQNQVSGQSIGGGIRGGISMSRPIESQDSLNVKSITETPITGNFGRKTYLAINPNTVTTDSTAIIPKDTITNSTGVEQSIVTNPSQPATTNPSQSYRSITRPNLGVVNGNFGGINKMNERLNDPGYVGPFSAVKQTNIKTQLPDWTWFNLTSNITPRVGNKQNINPKNSIFSSVAKQNNLATHINPSSIVTKGINLQDTIGTKTTNNTIPTLRGNIPTLQNTLEQHRQLYEQPKPSWIDRNADWAGPAVGAIGSIGAALMNYYSARHQAMPHRPVLLNPARMISQYNIRPQLSEFDRYAIVGQNNALQNTASSAAMRNQFNNINLNRVTEANKLWGTKTNEEAKMYNEDVKERNLYGNRNVDRLNRYYDALTAAQNQQSAAQYAALASIPEAFANGFNQYLTNRDTSNNNDDLMYNMVNSYEDNVRKKIIDSMTPRQKANYYKYITQTKRCGGKVSLKHNRF